MLSRVRALVVRWVFDRFFTLLCVAVCVGQAVVGLWLAPASVRQSVLSFPLFVAAAYALNVSIAGRGNAFMRRTPRSSLSARAYYAVTMASFLGGVYLTGVIAVWIVATRVFERTAQAGMVTVATVVPPLGGVFSFLGNVGLLTISVAFVYGFTIGQKRLRVREFRLPMRDLPPSFDGLKVAQISDIHIGENIDEIELERFVNKVNSLDPDLICITGDLIDSQRTEPEGGLKVLARLRARYGTLLVLGNHDHYAGPERVVAAVERWTDFRVLRDRVFRIERGSGCLHVIGLDDRGIDWARGMPLDPALTTLHGTVPPGEPAMLLCHRPDTFQHAAQLGIGLTLSGHTHGGQLGIPLGRNRVLNASLLMTPFDRGLFERNGAFLYVNCGLGVTLQRVRLATPREISVFHLQSAGDVEYL